jgi:hypothetical protein
VIAEAERFEFTFGDQIRDGIDMAAEELRSPLPAPRGFFADIRGSRE